MGKVIFSQACVILFTGAGRGWQVHPGCTPQMHPLLQHGCTPCSTDVTPPRCTPDAPPCCSMDAPPWMHSLLDHGWTHLLHHGCTPRCTASSVAWMHPIMQHGGNPFLPQMHPQEDRRSTGGRYASYWNAYLLELVLDNEGGSSAKFKSWTGKWRWWFFDMEI